VKKSLSLNKQMNKENHVEGRLLMNMEQTFKEAQALILKMEEKFKTYIILDFKQRLDMEGLYLYLKHIFKHQRWIVMGPSFHFKI